MRILIAALVAAVLGWLAGPLLGDRVMDRIIARQVQVDGWRVNYQLGDFAGNWLVRSVIARVALGALVADEALYYFTRTDGAGEPLSGQKDYVLYFPPEAIPPVGAFWSLTPYRAETLSLTDNPIDRYQLGDRTRGLAYGDDGSLTIYLSTDEPEVGAANWLPIPEGDFDLLLRTYEPSPEMLGGEWMPALVVSGGDQ